jgi:hypothetical protein
MLRFYAQHWDCHYPTLAEPPQRRYSSMIRDPEWVAFVRGLVARGTRPIAVRKRQWADFLRFATRSGPKLLRFWYQQSRFSAAHRSPHLEGLT